MSRLTCKLAIQPEGRRYSPSGSVLKFDGNLLGSRRRRASSSSQTSAKKDMAEATFAQLPLDLVLGRSSDLDL